MATIAASSSSNDSCTTLSLKETFLRAQEIFQALENGGNTTNASPNASDCAQMFEECSRLIRRENLFSANETEEDLTTSTLSYLPTAAELAAGPGHLTAIVPVLTTVLQVDGGGADLGLRFVDLAVQHAAEGYRINVYETAFSAVVVQRAAGVSFERCDITRVGGNGVRLGDGARGIGITDSRVALTGADGVQITGLDAADVAVRNTIVRDTATFSTQGSS